MTKCQHPSLSSSSLYPPVIVQIDQDLPTIKRAKEHAINGEIEIIRHDYDIVDSLE